MYTRDQIEKAVIAKGYKWFAVPENKGFDVNIVGIRNLEPGNKVTNVFDDWMTLSYKDEAGVWQFHCWPCTTDPGSRAMKEFSNKNGVSRLIPDQYRGTYEIRKHKGQYDAVCQKAGKKVKVWRDKNKDSIFDETAIFDDAAGINIHRTKADSVGETVGNWSEGCQVFKVSKNFDEFMKVCKIAAGPAVGKVRYSRNSFTYTLLTSEDMK